MKIAFYEVPDWEAEYLQKRLVGHELIFSSQIFDGQHPPDAGADIICTFTTSKLTADVLAGLPQLKFVTTRTTGFDHIDVKACTARGIPVSNVPTYGENTVAEFAFALLLALSRKIYPAVQRVRERGNFNFDGLRGFDLKDKILGVVGTGHIGTYVVKIAHGFGMQVVAFDAYPNEKLATEFGFRYLSLDELLSMSDVITLHVPYMPATHHLINKNNISLIKKGAVLINTARGAIVETEALVSALRQGLLAGAALDVLEEEGFIKEEMAMLLDGHPNADQLRTVLADHELMKMDNVIITPHTAFQTREAIQRILDTTIVNINKFIEGSPMNVVHQ